MLSRLEGLTVKTQSLTVLALCLVFAGPASRADDQADARALLDKAIKAMGGEAKLAKLGTASVKGKLTASEGGQNLEITLEGIWQGLQQYRADVEVQEGGTNFKGVLVFNGDKGWLKKMCNTEDAPPGVVPFIRNIFYAGRMPQLLPSLKDKAYTLSLLGEVKVGTEDAVGLSISHKDRKDVSLFFDKKTGLPLKSEIRLADPRDKEITVEFHYRDYKDFDGLKLCGKIGIKLDNKDITMELSEIKSIEKVEDSQFDRP
jgi:hypothetical protein